MYKCDNCGRISEPEEKPNKSFEYRPKEYENTKIIIDEKTRRKRKEKYITEGYEIKSEYNLCCNCIKEV